jgi:tRNA threonylcarbamoyladenosine biosynthesis protein TsaB
VRILAIDTSTNVASVAVVANGFADERDDRVTTHSERLLPMIAEVLGADRNVDLVACGAGPGSFTGLRIGLATAKGLAFALGKPLVVASSLAALAVEAEQAAENNDAAILAILDARRGEVYAGLYSRTFLPLAPEAVIAPDKLVEYAARAPRVVVVGEGAAAYPEAAARVGKIIAARSTPRATAVARLAAARHAAGVADELAQSAPVYLRSGTD